MCCVLRDGALHTTAVSTGYLTGLSIGPQPVLSHSSDPWHQLDRHVPPHHSSSPGSFPFLHHSWRLDKAQPVWKYLVINAQDSQSDSNNPATFKVTSSGFGLDFMMSTHRKAVGCGHMIGWFTIYSKNRKLNTAANKVCNGFDLCKRHLQRSNIFNHYHYLFLRQQFFLKADNLM